MDGVIETFGRHRLLSFDRDPDTREPTVEIAHEALLREWARLRGWIDEAREDPSGSRLGSPRRRMNGSGLDGIRVSCCREFGSPGERRKRPRATRFGSRFRARVFLHASSAHRDAEAAAERVRHQRELTLERRARTRLRGLVAVFAVGLLVAAGVTTVAITRAREAEHRRDEASVLGLTGTSLSNVRTEPGLSLLLALQAVNLSWSLDEPVPAKTVEALHWAIQALRIQYPVADGPIASVAGPLGYRGLYDMPVADLANLGLAHTDRTLTRNACLLFFGVPTCPVLPSRFPADLSSEPLVEGDTTGSELVPTNVTVGQVDDAGTKRELSRWSLHTGIGIDFTGGHGCGFDPRIPRTSSSCRFQAACASLHGKAS